MTFQSFSKRQLLAMSWWNQPETADLDGILCDGAVRSGKTMAITCGFFLWSMSRFDRQVFALCGKTVSALRRNLILPMNDWLGGILTITENRAENKLTVRLGNRRNTYYLFGGQDESSYMLIQGITLAGVLLDEVVLMPRSFVEQAAARCSVAGAKLWFACNPGSPEHWFYREWVCKAGEKRLLRLHFTMDDNPGLPAGVRARYSRLYTGVFYRRYVLGHWCAAEGRIYDFDPARHTVEIMQNAFACTQYPLPGRGSDGSAAGGGWSDLSEWQRSVSEEGASSPTRAPGTATGRGGWNGVQYRSGSGCVSSGKRPHSTPDLAALGHPLPGRGDGGAAKYYISVDYGVHNPFSAGLWAVRDGVAVRLREFYHDGRSAGKLMTDEEYHQALCELADGLPIEQVIIDPSAASMIALLRKRKVFRVRRADNRVLPGIRLVGSLLAEGRLRIGSGCKDAIREFSLYVWQDDNERDTPLKQNDHAMDDIRYFCMSVMKR